MDFPFHVRALESGITVRQLTTAFKTAAEAQKAADRENLRRDEKHVVCISLDPKDQRNPKGANSEHLKGWKVYDPETDADEAEEPKASTKKSE